MFQFFSSKSAEKDRVITLLSSQVHDLTDLIAKMQKDHAEQVKDLTDKLVAVANPPAFRAISTPPEPRNRLDAPPRTSRLPGFRPVTRPPDPETPPTGKPIPIPVEIVPEDKKDAN